MPDFDEAKARQLIADGYGQVLQQVAIDCSAPIFWFDPARHEGQRLVDNGTVFFVNSGLRTFGVTAAHVVQGYYQNQQSGGSLRCQIYNVLFPLEQRLICVSENLDLATLDVQPDEITEMGKVIHEPAHAWPPGLPQAGRGVFFAGFPGGEREEGSSNVIWGQASALVPVTDVQPDRLHIVFERASWIPNDNAPLPPEDVRWGGISGGPVFAIIEGNVVTWRIVAVISQILEGYEILRATPISSIQTDGSINHFDAVSP